MRQKLDDLRGTQPLTWQKYQEWSPKRQPRDCRLPGWEKPCDSLAGWERSFLTMRIRECKAFQLSGLLGQDSSSRSLGRATTEERCEAAPLWFPTASQVSSYSRGSVDANARNAKGTCQK